MRKIVLITALLVLVAAVPVFAEIELGLSWTPVLADEQSINEDMGSIYGFHLGYRFWEIFYVSWDSLIMPSDVINGLVGYQRPGYLNLINGGLGFHIGPIVLYATAGINNVYVYKQDDLTAYEPEFGANLRVGAGLKFDWWGVNVSGTSVFASFERMAQTLAALGDDTRREIAMQKIIAGLIPSVNFSLYF